MKENKFLQAILTTVRILVGLLFIFSGLIKANDPSGLAYKMSEFFEVWTRDGYLPKLMAILNDYTLPFSIMMITFEIVAGVALIIGYRFKLFSYLILLLTIFFTFLTAYAMFSGKIKECGCFGDCIKLQANESFWKDIVLLVLISIIVLLRKSVKQAFSNPIANAVMIISFIACLLMQWFVLKHLPFKDCLAYKIGNNINTEMTPDSTYEPAVVATTLVYKKNGKKQEFTMENYPWEDSTWVYDTTINKVIKEEQNAPRVKDFIINNYNGEDITQTILNYPGNLFIVIIKNVNEANTSNIEKLVALEKECLKNNVPIIALSASGNLETGAFKKQHGLIMEFTTLDGTTCKTAMRANPGIMLLKKGTINGKWSYADYPTFSTLNLNVSDNTSPLFQAPSIEESESPQATTN
jgi:uncharacterized membrane protein YphA (DoxX/SURF4 family)